MNNHFWTEGNRLELLENGEEFFPRVFEAIAHAKEEVLVETFILFDDETGQALKQCLIDAAGRGVKIELVVDGYGSEELPAAFIEAMTGAGIKFKMFDPRPRLLNTRTNVFRRLHRKTVIVDALRVFIGGINFSNEHLRSFGDGSKQDYAVVVQGPVVEHVRRYFCQCNEAPARPRRRWRWQRRLQTALPGEHAGATGAMLVVRDNDEHRDDIERMYMLGIRSAKRDIIIANAYFLPGFRFVRELRRAVARGVNVELILQGNPDKPIVRWATTALYDELLRAGARIHEYCERPLHAKVAVIDDAWATVGSSNLDPLSLSLNLESNLVIRDPAFNAELRRNLEGLIAGSCRELTEKQAYLPPLARRLLGVFVYHLLRWMPVLFNGLPARAKRQKLVSVGAEAAAP